LRIEVDKKIEIGLIRFSQFGPEQFPFFYVEENQSGQEFDLEFIRKSFKLIYIDLTDNILIL
jgi:hypothetical protein